jgi:capsular exopolysaccharide synthesis family protein
MTSFTPLPPMDGAILRNRSGGMRRDVAATWDALWRRKWIPLVGALVGVTVGVGALLFMPPLYKASTRIMIDNPDNKAGVVDSEAAIIRSTPVLAKVAGSLALYSDPQFAKPQGVLRHVVQKPQLMDTGKSERVMNRLDAMIRIRVLPNTSIIDMTVHNPDPDRAAQIANALLTAYQERKVDERFEQSRQMSAWIGKQMDAIKTQGNAARAKLAAFESAHPQGLNNDNGVQAQRVVALSHEMAQTQNDIDELSRKLTAAQTEDKAKSAQKIVRIQGLKAQQANQQAELAALQKTYGDLHPKIVEQKTRIARTHADLRAAENSVTPNIDRDLSAARNRLDALQKQIEALSVSTDASSRDRMELKNLQDDVAANDRLYSDLMIKYQAMAADTQLRGNDIKVISMATIPSTPDQSARIAMLIGLGLAGFLCGLVFVALRLAWATGFTTAAQLEGMTGYPVFAAVPVAGGKFSKNGAVHHNVMQDPAALLAESLRSLRVSLRLRGESGKRPRVVAFTSTLPEEGKTSLAVMLAMIAAKSGERVCVVDCDLRRPSVHKAFGIGNARGLADYLSDRLGIDDVIYRKDPSGVHLVTAKAVPSYSLTLLTSGRMERLLDNLREQYDLVILDAPSSLAFADARVLARMVDQTLYVVAWNRTRRESVVASLKAYADLGYADLALVLNKVDLNEYLRDSAAVVVYQYGREPEESYA